MHGQIKTPYLKLGPKNTGPLFHSKSLHTLTHTCTNTLAHTVSRFDQVQLHSTAQRNYLWRPTHAFTLHSGIFIYIYIIYKRKWEDTLHTSMNCTLHCDVFYSIHTANTRAGYSNASELASWINVSESQRYTIFFLLKRCCMMFIKMSGHIWNLVYLFFDQIVSDLNLNFANFI